MDGTVDELVRLEENKRRALIGLDGAGYQRAVEAQTGLLPRLTVPGGGTADPAKLKAFVLLADLNTQLYENLLTTTSLGLPSGQRYTGDGRTDDPATPSQTFSAKA